MIFSIVESQIFKKKKKKKKAFDLLIPEMYGR